METHKNLLLQDLPNEVWVDIPNYEESNLWQDYLTEEEVNT